MKTDHIKKRNMIMQIVLMLITLGIYAIYWLYYTLRELHIANGKDPGALPWAVLALIPLSDLWPTGIIPVNSRLSMTQIPFRSSVCGVGLVLPACLSASANKP